MRACKGGYWDEWIFVKVIVDVQVFEYTKLNVERRKLSEWLGRQSTPERSKENKR